MKSTPVQVEKLKTAKPGAAIKLVSPNIIYINPNERVPIEILLESKSSGELSIDLLPTPGLELLDTQIKYTIDVIPSSLIKIPAALSAANGRYHLDIHAKLDDGDAISTRNIAVIVQVGPATEQTVQFKKTTGENVISLPAQETISNQ